MWIYHAIPQKPTLYRLCYSRHMEQSYVTIGAIYQKFPLSPFWLYDSGGYTIDVRGDRTLVSLDDYSRWLLAARPKFYASLDIVGDAEVSKKNYLALLDLGLSPMPIFHSQEDEKYLRFYLERCSYIGLGGVAGAEFKGSPALARRWLDRSFRIIKEYWPVKIHGFGITNPSFLLRYPFCSVDSSSAVAAVKFGKGFRFDTFTMRMKGYDLPRKYFREGWWPYDQTFMRALSEYDKMENAVTDLWKSRGVEWKE